ncbi:preprotein translocase subunit SecG [Sphingosinicella sp. BN140058]|uniref:preprotein translocase subunit SecG n=1 Tax=Sphingosinicella sp. BN140058 TaxID=1892855 RepID=UPI001011EB00|nr:preprotein translocase subunit SecG [Sphingosinicella sp. BN140058]QAY79106.1 preprotein translocase subunit SecG [Sphingosinicella sp. BN140058]
MFTFFLIVQTLVAAALVAVILMQRSEGGGLGMGGSPSGLMSARGAADFLTRATSILGGLFVILSIVLAGLAAIERAPMRIDPAAVAPSPTPVSPAPVGTPAAPATDPLTGAAQRAPAPGAASAPAPSNGAVPIAQ